MIELCTRNREIRGDRGNNQELLGLREFRVRVNGPSLIWQVRVLSQWVITPFQGLLNPSRQVGLQISHSRSYRPYLSRLHPPSLSFLSTALRLSQKHRHNSSLYISPRHHHELSLGAAYTSYSIHWVQLTPRSVCRPIIFTISSSPQIVASASSIYPYRSNATS